MSLATWLAVASLAAAPATQIDGIDLPDDLPTPTQAQVDRSVQRWTADHIARSVHQWSTERSVTPLVEESTDGDETTLTLLSDLLFEFGSADVDESAVRAIRAELDKVPDGATVQVVGHTDSIGSTDVNRKLSEERAQAVATIIAGDRSDLDVEAEGRGASEPVADNTTGGEDNPAGRMLNRRVEVSFTR